MNILHISAECYPAAKAGGLGDVVGALPKYLSASGMPAAVIIPKYGLKWIEERDFTTVYKGAVRLHNSIIPFTIEKENEKSLGFALFVANIPGKFDRPGIYADPGGHPFGDELVRYLCFQQSVLQWIANSPGKPKLLHCHDHHTALIPFMVKHCPEYQSLKNIPTVFTIHNGSYHGAFGWERLYLLPWFDAGARGLLDWNNAINPLACAVKCAWRITTVSPSYLEELKENSNGLEWLFQHEQHKALGILNGIDTQVWDPAADPFIAKTLNGQIGKYKAANKKILTKHFDINPGLPLITFIGRLVGEKGADLLPALLSRTIQSGMQLAFVVLGTGEQSLMEALRQMKHRFPGNFDAALEYNETLAHQLYAGTDFLLMPSRVEPCGLNQMYAMRYGSLPIVRSVGGLKDTVPDIGEADGSGLGIRFDNFALDDAQMAVYRATGLYRNKKQFGQIRKKIMQIDFSWENSANQYIDIYNEMI